MLRVCAIPREDLRFLLGCPRTVEVPRVPSGGSVTPGSGLFCPWRRRIHARKNSPHDRLRHRSAGPGGRGVRWRWGDTSSGHHGVAPAPPGGEVVVAGCTPKNALIPGNTSEACGGDIISAMSAGLVHYNTDNAAPEMDIAQSIDTSDNKLFTVKLKPYKFQDGTDVKAKNFVDAWNYTAYGPNGQAGSYFFAPDRRLRGHAVPGRGLQVQAQGREVVGSEGGRRHDVHDPDQRTGVEPAGAPRLLRVRPAAGLLLHRREGLRGQADRRRAVQGGLDQQHRVRAEQVRRLLGHQQGERRQAHLPDLPGPLRGLRRRRGRQPRLHRRLEHPAGPVHRRCVQERLP